MALYARTVPEREATDGRRQEMVSVSSYRFNTKRVCCKQIRFDVEDGQLHNVKFLGGGCEGNLRAMSTLLEGHDAQDAIAMLKGTPCGKRGTSCGDQLAMAIEDALADATGEGAGAAIQGQPAS